MGPEDVLRQIDELGQQVAAGLVAPAEAERRMEAIMQRLREGDAARFAGERAALERARRRMAIVWCALILFALAGILLVTSGR